MLDPIRLVTDLFKEKNLSDADLRAFTEDFLARLANPENNPAGIYNSMLVGTTNRYQNYYGNMSTQLSKEAIGKGLTISMNNALDAVLSKLRGLQGLIKFKFGDKSEVYKEFYPQEMKQYYNASLGETATLFARFLEIAVTHLQVPYPAEVAELTILIDNFTAARHAQEINFSTVDNIATDRHSSRKALTIQLTRCFLRIASDTVENPDKFDDYYEPRYLPIRKGKKKEKTEKEPV